MRPFRPTFAIASFVLVLAIGAPASAGERETPAAPGIIGEAQRWLSAAAAAAAVPAEATTHPDAPLFDFASTSLSLVVRDWHGSLRLAGDRTLLVDDLRPTAANRLVVARVATDAKLTTFVQLGIGEWRIDPAMFPNARSYSESAAQASTGFELRLPSGLRVAGEAQYTALHHDLHYSADEVAPRIVAFFVAIEGRL